MRAAVEIPSDSCLAVGRAEFDSLQHNCTNSQRESEKPKDLAKGGFFGRSPLSITGIGVRAEI